MTGEYVWMGTGKPVKVSQYKWLPGKPSNDAKTCVGIWDHDSDEHLMNDTDCTHPNYFICEYICDE